VTLVNFLAVLAYAVSVALVLSRFREYLVFFAYLSFVQDGRWCRASITIWDLQY